ncbi:MAG: DUF202 domain-containing protein [Caulobacter sp.]|nr:DUF202 domain-containing protein [Caulobacter sp.]
MSNKPELPKRPERIELPSPPALPEVSAQPEFASVQYSTHRTKLSTFRTKLSEHRTDLSEYRSDLSTYRTSLSTHRTEMSMRRTGMSFQRTRMSDDRTLMSVIRTSLSLIGFGFTIYQTFQKLHEAGTIANPNAARNFGIILVLLGIVMLIVGMIHHVQFMMELRHTRREMKRQGLIHGDSRFPVSITFMVSLGLLLLGFAAIVNMVFKVAVFG